MKVDLNRSTSITFVVGAQEHTVSPVTIGAWRIALQLQKASLDDMQLRVAAVLCGQTEGLESELFLPTESLSWLLKLTAPALDDLIICLTAMHEGLNPETVAQWLEAERKKATAARA